jgi:hypothetical protein
VSRRGLLWGLGIAVGLFAGGLAVTAWLAGELGLLGPNAAHDAAVAQYQARTGLTHVRVEAAAGWSDCAVVELFDPVARAGAAVVLLQDGGHWRIIRTSGEDVGFDTDDVIGEHQGCLDLARSTGPVTNGAPDG